MDRVALIHSAMPAARLKQVIRDELGVAMRDRTWALPDGAAGTVRWLLAHGRCNPKHLPGVDWSSPPGSLTLDDFLSEPVRVWSSSPEPAVTVTTTAAPPVPVPAADVDWDGWSPSPSWATPADPTRRNLLDEHLVVANRLGIRLMPWQKQVLATATELDGDGLPVYDDVLVTVGRQQGKSLLMLVAICRWLSRRDTETAYVASNFRDAIKLWQGKFWRDLQKSGLVETWGLRLIRSATAAGLHSDVFGSVCHILTGSREAGHGLTLNFVVCDEAWSYTDNRHEESLEPAMSTFDDKQIWMISTAGDDKSVFLRERVETSRALIEAGKPSPACYMEWSAPPDADYRDPEVWRQCMPALGRTISVRSTMQAMRKRGEAHFRRTRLNTWAHDNQHAVGVFPSVLWQACCSEFVDIADDAKVWVAVDAPPSQNRAAVAVSDGVSVGLVRYGEGWEWLKGFLIELLQGRKVQQVVAPGLSVDDHVRAACNQSRFDNFEVVDTAAMARASARMKASVTEGSIKVKSSNWVDAAVVASLEYPVRSGRGWVYRHRPIATATDISPLWAVSLAWHFARVAAEEPPRPRMRVKQLGGGS